MSRILGAHTAIFSTSPDADRDFLRDVLKLDAFDAGGGYIIFALPPSEVHVHPSEKNDVHEFYLLCDDIQGFAAEMKAKNVPCSPVQDLGWGLLVSLTLPGGGKLGVYQARYANPNAGK